MVLLYMVSEAQKRANAKYHQKMKDDPDYKAKRTEIVKRYYQRKKDDPEFKQKINERSKAYYHRNKDEILEKRKQKYQNQKNS